MANERTMGEPLTATVGERLGEKAREGDTAGLDRAQAAVDDLRRAGWEEPARAADAGTGRPPARPRARPGGGGRGAGLGWALAAGLGALAVVGIVRRALGR